MIEVIAGLVGQANSGKIRLIVKNHHDYVFKDKGREVGRVTKKEVVLSVDGQTHRAADVAAKELWRYTKSLCGHSIEGLV